MSNICKRGQRTKGGHEIISGSFVSSFKEVMRLFQEVCEFNSGRSRGYFRKLMTSIHGAHEIISGS